jgi:starch synthase
MHVVHLLRKCNPAEWGGTESAVERLADGLWQNQVSSVVYCPTLESGAPSHEPLARNGCTVKRFKAFLPVVGISRQQRDQLISVGGNLLSFDLPRALWREPDISVIHTHALGRLGGIAMAMARMRKVPLVTTIHGGYLDLPEKLRTHFKNATSGGWEWGKVCGFFLKSRQLVPEADAVLTCNPKEANLLREQYPHKRIVVQPHGVPTNIYRTGQQEAALAAFPQIHFKQVLLCVGRIDPVKNQGWLVEQAPALLQRHPKAILVLAGACTDAVYGEKLQQEICKLGLEQKILVTGGFQPTDPRLIGLFQMAQAVVVPSISETFGLVILEAWAAGTTVISSRTSGALSLVKPGHNGWLFDLQRPEEFHTAVDEVLQRTDLAGEYAANGAKLVDAEYDVGRLGGRVKDLYEQLIEEKHALRHSARR